VGFCEFFSPKTLFPASFLLCLKLDVLFSYLPILVIQINVFVINNGVKWNMIFVHPYLLFRFHFVVYFLFSFKESCTDESGVPLKT